MVPLPPNPAISSTATTAAASTNGLVVTLMGSVNSLWAMWKKKKGKPNSSSPKSKSSGDNSSLAKSKKFLGKINGKATNLMRKIKAKNKEVENGEDFGDGGLWQKEILMGDKCQPLDFSGVIYYDRNGKRLSEVPVKSPRASPLPSNRYT
ncbi:uncharacterized protein LOC129901450 [Solanum dulcamara]|uniref:uncharacterized protein LOC129901450 n=1 Tax=Solanum dulcamara TaxID=45834 RepID=UPI0024860160|nr:uncharacterized protein LOC129901450 [Solanum dulcamara]